MEKREKYELRIIDCLLFGDKDGKNELSEVTGFDKRDLRFLEDMKDDANRADRATDLLRATISPLTEIQTLAEDGILAFRMGYGPSKLTQCAELAELAIPKVVASACNFIADSNAFLSNAPAAEKKETYKAGEIEKQGFEFLAQHAEELPPAPPAVNWEAKYREAIVALRQLSKYRGKDGCDEYMGLLERVDVILADSASAEKGKENE